MSKQQRPPLRGHVIDAQPYTPVGVKSSWDGHTEIKGGTITLEWEKREASGESVYTIRHIQVSPARCWQAIEALIGDAPVA